VLFALFLLSLSCPSKPLLLLLLERRSRNGIRCRSSSLWRRTSAPDDGDVLTELAFAGDRLISGADC
jgi:hypothetical protein